MGSLRLQWASHGESVAGMHPASHLCFPGLSPACLIDGPLNRWPFLHAGQRTLALLQPWLGSLRREKRVLCASCREIGSSFSVSLLHCQEGGLSRRPQGTESPETQKLPPSQARFCKVYLALKPFTAVSYG
eukprot:s5497_g2.t1